MALLLDGMICIKLLESWLPIPSAASMLHPVDIAVSHETAISSAILFLITELYQVKQPSSCYQYEATQHQWYWKDRRKQALQAGLAMSQ